MSEQVIEAARLSDLRTRATARLAGNVVSRAAPPRITDALSALYTLASSPQTAADALALLHELQVHQVELDLQAQELRESRAELETTLRRQVALHDALPVGSFTIDARLVVHDLNLAGARMLGIEPDAGPGARLASFLSAESTQAVETMAARARAGASRLSQRLQLSTATGAERTVQANLCGEAGTSRCILVLAELDDEPDAQLT